MDIENLVQDLQTEPEDIEETLPDVDPKFCTASPKRSESASAVQETCEISLSELKQDLPKLPPKQPQVPPRPPLSSRSKPPGSQSFSAAPPRPPAFQPRPVHRALSASASPPVIPPRAPRTVAAHHQSTLSSLPPAIPSSRSVIIPHPASPISHSSPDAGALGTTFNYVYFTEDAVPPPTQQLSTPKNRKQKHSPDFGFVGGRHSSIGKKLADSGLGSVNVPCYNGGDEPHSAGSYVRLAVSPPLSTDDSMALHDYCYPSIDAVVPAPTVSICRIEPQHSPPPLPTKSRRVGWWDCHGRKKRARCSQLQASWRMHRTTMYGTEPSVVMSRVSLNNSRSSSLNTRQPSTAWRSRLLCFVRTCVLHPCRWRRRWTQRRRSVLSCGRASTSPT